MNKVMRMVVMKVIKKNYLFVHCDHHYVLAQSQRYKIKINDTFRRVMLKYVSLNWLVYIKPRFLKLIPDDLKAQEICNEAIEKVPWLLHYVPLHLRTKKMCYRAIVRYLYPMTFIADHLKMQEM